MSLGEKMPLIDVETAKGVMDVFKRLPVKTIAKIETVQAKVEVKAPETKKAKILREHNYLESNIPINSEYWQMR